MSVEPIDYEMHIDSLDKVIEVIRGRTTAALETEVTVAEKLAFLIGLRAGLTEELRTMSNKPKADAIIAAVDQMFYSIMKDVTDASLTV